MEARNVCTYLSVLYNKLRFLYYFSCLCALSCTASVILLLIKIEKLVTKKLIYLLKIMFINNRIEIRERTSLGHAVVKSNKAVP